MVEYNIMKRYSLAGLDLRSSDLNRSPISASGMSNFTLLDGDIATSREGYKTRSTDAANGVSYGMASYGKVSTDTGEVTIEKLIVGKTLYRVIEGTFTVAYTGAAAGSLTLLVDDITATFHLELFEDDASVLDVDLGVGFDVASPLTLASLKTSVDAVADWSATIAGAATTLPAALLEQTSIVPVDGSGYALDIYDTEEVNHPTGPADDPFEDSFTNQFEDFFENVSQVQNRNVIYLSNGYNFPIKYDGVDAYRMGLPAAPTISTAGSGGGALAAGTYFYRYFYSQIDAQGNLHESAASLFNSITTGAPEDINVTVSNILNTTGFNTDCAIVAGAQGPVTTITVDDGSGGSQTMKVGQTAYFFDSVSAGYVTREITSVTTSSITIAGAGVTVADNAVISNNLRIVITRSLAGGTDQFINVELPNNSFTATQVYTDGLADASLGAAFIDPALFGAEHGVVPKGKYVSIYKGRILIAGDLEEPNRVYFSDILSPEGFPSSNAFDIFSLTNSPITGIGPADEYFWVFKESESHFLTGDLGSGQFERKLMADDIGCVAHNTIQSLDASLVWVGDRGVYQSVNGSKPVNISKDIFPIFDNKRKQPADKVRLKRAVAIYDQFNENYIAYLPTETVLPGGTKYDNSGSRTMVFDTYRGAWFEWNNLKMGGGLIQDGEDLWWAGRRFSTFSSSVDVQVHKRLNSGEVYDFVDHVDAISSFYTTGWEPVQEPSMLKKFNKIKAFASDRVLTSAYTLTIETEKNYIPDDTHSLTTMEFGGPDAGGDGFGLSPFGDAAFGDPAEEQDLIRCLLPDNIRALRTKFSHNERYKQPIITGYEYEIALSYEVTMTE